MPSLRFRRLPCQARRACKHAGTVSSTVLLLMAEAHTSAVHLWNQKQNSMRQELANYLSLIMDINQCLVTTSTPWGHCLPEPMEQWPVLARWGMGSSAGITEPRAGRVQQDLSLTAFYTPSPPPPPRPGSASGSLPSTSTFRSQSSFHSHALDLSSSTFLGPPVLVSLSASSLLPEWPN